MDSPFSGDAFKVEEDDDMANSGDSTLMGSDLYEHSFDLMSHSSAESALSDDVAEPVPLPQEQLLELTVLMAPVDVAVSAPAAASAPAAVAADVAPPAFELEAAASVDSEMADACCCASVELPEEPAVCSPSPRYSQTLLCCLLSCVRSLFLALIPIWRGFLGAKLAASCISLCFCVGSGGCFQRDWSAIP